MLFRSVTQCARLAVVVVPQNLTGAATARFLDEILTLPDGLKFNALERVSEQKWLKDALPGKILELQKLLSKAHPLYRPAIEHYLVAAQELGGEKLFRYRRAVREGDAERAKVEVQLREIAGALDHAEHAYSRPATNALQPCLRAEIGRAHV